MVVLTVHVRPGQGDGGERAAGIAGGWWSRPAIPLWMSLRRPPLGDGEGERKLLIPGNSESQRRGRVPGPASDPTSACYGL